MSGVPSLTSFVKALQFVILCRLKPVENSHSYTQIRLRDEYLDANVYLPPIWFSEKKVKGTIVVIHGMSAMGNADPRIIIVCEAFARCGYAVISPSFRDIADFCISAETIDRIVETLCAIASDRLLCPKGKVMVFAPSFSAGMSLIASSHPGCADIVESICSVGAYGSVDTVIHDLLTREDFDEYGRLIIMKNFIHHAPGFGDETGEVLCEAILDNGLKRAEAKFPLKLAAVRGPHRRRILRLLGDVDFRRKVWHDILSRSRKVRVLMKELSVVDKLSRLKARVALIHGNNDNVISPEESRSIYLKLQELRVPSSLCITPLIGHGDAQTENGFFRHLFQLVGAFAFFLG